MSKPLCFVIGPMRNPEDLSRQRRLATEILGPLLASRGFDVSTPDLPQEGQIMRQVMASLDRADLVVADITGSNPSVMYELGIRHCIGLPTVMVRHRDAQAAAPAPDDPIAFDLRHYRYKELDLDDAATAREALRPMLEATLGRDTPARALKGDADNPVTEYYKNWPMIEASPAAGLALGYYINLVKRTAKALCDPNAKIFLLDDKKVQTGELTRDRIEHLNIYIPRDLRQSSVSHADTFRNRMKAQNCEIAVPGSRAVATYFVEQQRSLLDIPTTLGALEEAVKRRVPGDPGLNSEISRFVLSREIDRFIDVAKRLIEDETHESDKVIDFLTDRVFFYDLPD